MYGPRQINILQNIDVNIREMLQMNVRNYIIVYYRAYRCLCNQPYSRDIWCVWNLENLHKANKFPQKPLRASSVSSEPGLYGISWEYCRKLTLRSAERDLFKRIMLLCYDKILDYHIMVAWWNVTGKQGTIPSCSVGCSLKIKCNWLETHEIISIIHSRVIIGPRLST